MSRYYCQVGFFFFFWKKDAFKRSRWIEKPNSQQQRRVWAWMRGVHVIQGKGPKYLAFLTALRFMKTMIWIRKKKKCWWKELALQQRTELQAALVCTVTKRDAAWGKKKTKKEKNHLTLNKQTMKHNATVEKYKANNVITRWSLQGDITLLCD